MSMTNGKYFRREIIAYAVLGCFVIAVAAMLLTNLTGPAAAKGKMSTPLVSCGGSAPGYIDIRITGGSQTGAPAGFTVQWQTSGDYARYGWPSSENCPLDAEGNPTCGESACAASFSGNAALSNYSLAPGQSVTVRIGDLLLDNGASSDCTTGKLSCDHNYVFRVFAHANSARQRSDFTSNLTCATSACPIDCDPNVKNLNFWVTHSMFCNLGEGCQQDAWPASVLENGMTIGCNSYSAAELEAILLTTPEGDDCMTALLHQVIVTKLNIANGASEDYLSATEESLSTAEAFLCGGEGDCASLTHQLDSGRADFECPQQQ